MASSSCMRCSKLVIAQKPNDNKMLVLPIGNRVFVPHGTTTTSRPSSSRVCVVRASMVDSYESSFDFVKRMEKAWLISQQPRPINCTSCNSNGHVECKWCGGTGFFILGDNMLCQVPSRNTSCVICSGKGSKCCSDCKGTGFRAKWLGEPPISK